MTWASRSANPGLLRTWRPPPPKDDVYDIVFPFTVSEYDLTGVVSFLKEHFNNFSDLPVWDMLFGTYANPKEHYKACGFKPEREARLMDMLLFRNVNDKRDA